MQGSTRIVFNDGASTAPQVLPEDSNPRDRLFATRDIATDHDQTLDDPSSLLYSIPEHRDS